MPVEELPCPGSLPVDIILPPTQPASEQGKRGRVGDGHAAPECCVQPHHGLNVWLAPSIGVHSLTTSLRRERARWQAKRSLDPPAQVGRSWVHLPEPTAQTRRRNAQPLRKVGLREPPSGEFYVENDEIDRELHEVASVVASTTTATVIDPEREGRFVDLPLPRRVHPK